METEIYFFSGTGNSFFVAKELQKRLSNAEIVPIVKLLNEGSIQTKGKCIGIVFPVHALSIPIAIHKFLKRVDIESAEYVFVIATRLGIVFHDFNRIVRLLKRKGKKLNAHFLINMYSNDSKDKQYQVPSIEEIKQIEDETLCQLDEIGKLILNRKDSLEDDKTYLTNLPYNKVGNFFLEKIVTFLLRLSEYIGGVNYFYHDSKCTGCGICERVCLSTKVRMVNRHPIWQKKVLCYMCYACLNYCPAFAVQIKDIPGVKSHSKDVGRYTHPYANSKDILLQK
jgi:ferredoxin